VGGSEVYSNIEDVSSPECLAAYQETCSELQAKFAEALEEVAALQDSEAEAPTRLQSEVGSRQESTNDSVDSTEDDVANVTEQCAAALQEEAPVSQHTNEAQTNKDVSPDIEPASCKRWPVSLPVGRGSIALQWTRKVGISKRPRRVALIVVMAFVLVMIRFLFVGSAPSPSISSPEWDPLLMPDHGPTFCQRPGFLAAPARKQPSAHGQ